MDFNVLSVDWDYFFPDTQWYDWGHRENEFFINDVWHFRSSNVHLKTGVSVLDEFHPKGYEDFWDKTVGNNVPPMLAISESHSNLWELLAGLSKGMELGQLPFDNTIVWNFDAHHDLGYEKLPDGFVDCGNWAWRAIDCQILDTYNIIFPEWKSDDQKLIADQVDFDFYEHDINLYYSIPENLPVFQMVFICRSGAWTPPWHDYNWYKFIGWWTKHNEAWNDKQLFHDPLSMRSPDMEQAKKECEEMKEVLRKQAN